MRGSGYAWSMGAFVPILSNASTRLGAGQSSKVCSKMARGERLL